MKRFFLIGIAATALLLICVFYLESPYGSKSASDICVYLAEKCASNGDDRRAAFFYEKAMDKCEISLSDTMALVRLYASMNDYDRAQELLENIIKSGDETVSVYTELSRIKTARGMLDDAIAVLDSAKGDTVRMLIGKKRPAPPTFSKESGDTSDSALEIYSSYGNRIYFRKSPGDIWEEYGGTLTLERGDNTIYSVAVSRSGIVSCESSIRLHLIPAPYRLSFEDKGIEACVRYALSVSEGPIMSDAGKSLFALSNKTDTGEIITSSIRSLNDLSKFPEIKSISIYGLDSSPDLYGLSALKQIERVTLSSCRITDDDAWALANVTSIRALDLSGNSISSAKFVKNLHDLTFLSLKENDLSDIGGIETLDGLMHLDISQNGISDVSKIAELKNLMSLYMSGNDISELPKFSCGEMYYIDISRNSISDISPIGELLSLSCVIADGNLISDISGISRLKGLKTFSASYNLIEDLSPLSDVRSLEILNVRHNRIRSLDPVKGLYDLKSIDVSENPAAEEQDAIYEDRGER